MRRTVRLLIAMAACLAAVPLTVPNDSRLQPTAATLRTDRTASEAPITPEVLARLATTDAVAALEASLTRYQLQVRGYRCVFVKQERQGGRLGPVEQIRIAFRDDPFAVRMQWEQGAGLASATVYVEGENDGQLLARTPLGVVPSDPNGRLARGSARYSIRDFGIRRGAIRTLNAWKAAAAAGRLRVEYLGLQEVPQLGRRCFVLRRTCDPPEVDHFAMSDTGQRSPEQFPKEAIASVAIMLDAETGLHVGSELHHPDGSLLASYFFRDLAINPIFERDEFQRSRLTAKPGG